MDQDKTQASMVRKACIACGKEFTGDVTVCPEDKTPLTALAKEIAVGSVIGDRYEIIETVGTGGMGVVYRAKHKLMKRIVAIKMLHANLVSNATTLKRFQHEAQAASTLNHPNILTVFDFGLTDEGQPYLVMDYLEGVSFADVLQEEGNVEVNRALKIFIQTCAALAHAHQKGIVHRDLKPSNIMLVDLDGDPDFVKIVDFGIAKIVSMEDGETSNLTRTGEIFGSPLYMSPEQCRGKTLDARTDIYSMGCVMYRALAGMSPFMGQDQLDLMFKQVNDIAPSFSEVCPDLFLSAEVEAIVVKCLAKSPDDRFQSMVDLKQELERVAGFGTQIATQIQPAQAATAPGVDAAISPGAAPRAGTQLTEEISMAQAAAARGQASAAAGQVISALKSQFLSRPLPVRLAIGAALGIVGALIALSLWQGDGSRPGAPSPAVSKDQKLFDRLMAEAQEDYKKGSYDEAERVAEQAQNTARTIPGFDKQYAESLNFLGTVNYAQGQYHEASSYLQKALTIRQKVFGDSSAEVATTKTVLGRTFSALGEYVRAGTVLNQALATRLKIFGERDVSVADTLSALADVDLRQKHYDAAISKLNQALQVREIAEGKDSVDAATAWNDLAQAYQLKHDLGQALLLYKRALDIRQKKLPADSPLIAESYFCIATLCAQTGQVPQAKALFQSALDIQEKSLAPNSPLIAATRKRLADLQKQPARKGGRTSFSSLLAK